MPRRGLGGCCIIRDMLQDHQIDVISETQAITPIENFLNTHGAEILLQQDSPIHPEYIQECTFETDRIGNTIGRYSRYSQGIDVVYEIERLAQRLNFTLEAPLQKWLQWNQYIPKDFADAIIKAQGDETIPIPLLEKHMQYDSKDGKLQTEQPTHIDLSTWLYFKEKYIHITKVFGAHPVDVAEHSSPNHLASILSRQQ